MVQGLPFDFSDEINGGDYTLDTTVVSDDDDDTQFDLDLASQLSSRIRQAKEEKDRLLDEGAKAVLDFDSFLASVKNLSLDESLQSKRECLKLRNEELCKIRDQIQEQDNVQSAAELELLESENKRTSYEIKRAIKEKNIEHVTKAIEDAESVDLAFILDATTSMRTMLASVKSSIREIVAQVRRTNIDLKLRLAVVVYRDLEYYQPSQVLDFETDIHRFEAFLESIQCCGEEGRRGPRDIPEDMAGGIQGANRLSWKNLTRVAFLIADAPCHGQEFHSFEDNHPSGTPGIDIELELRTLMNRRGHGTMSVFFGRMAPWTDQMIERFVEVGLPLSVVKISNAKEVVSSVTQGVRSSIFKTMTAAGRSNANDFSLGRVSFNAESLLKNSAGGVRRTILTGAKLKPYCVIPRLPSVAEWQNQPAILVKVYNNKAIATMKDVQKPLSVGLLRYVRSLFWKKEDSTEVRKESTMVLRRAAAPFAEGSMRIAFHGQLARTEDELSLDKSNVVMKSFKHAGEELNGLKHYLRQMELSNIANFLAKEYNKVRRLNCGSVHVLKSCVVEEEEVANEGRGSRRFCAEEPLPTESSASSFTKYSNNTGYWNDDEMHETLLRFTQFTYSATNQYLMVTDLQGIQVGDDFYLTDPAILCTDLLRFGYTNLGEKFMKKCVEATNHHLAEHGWNTL